MKIIIDDDGIMHKVIPVEELQEIQREINSIQSRFRDPGYVSGHVETIHEVLAIIRKHLPESEEQA